MRGMKSPGEIFDLGFKKKSAVSGQKLRQKHEGGVAAVRNRESLIHVNIAQLVQFFRKNHVVFLLSRIFAQILQQNHARPGKAFFLEVSRERGNRRNPAVVGFKVRHQNHRSASFQKIADGRERLVYSRLPGFHRIDVEIHPHQNPPPAQFCVPQAFHNFTASKTFENSRAFKLAFPIKITAESFTRSRSPTHKTARRPPDAAALSFWEISSSVSPSSRLSECPTIT